MPSLGLGMDTVLIWILKNFKDTVNNTLMHNILRLQEHQELGKVQSHENMET